MHGEYAATYCIFSGLFLFLCSEYSTKWQTNMSTLKPPGRSKWRRQSSASRCHVESCPLSSAHPHNKDPGSNGLSRPEAHKHPQYTVLSIIVTESMESLVLNDMNETSIVTTLDTISLHSKHWDFLFIYLFCLIMWFDWNVIHLDNEVNRTLELVSTDRVRLSASTAVAPAARLML